MKRAFPQKVKPVTSRAMSELERLSQALASDAEAWDEQKQVLPEAPRRRARTSAAMIGLALSMGASHLLLPQQDDGAMAAEPMASEPSSVGLADAPVAPSVPEDQTVAFSFPESSSTTHSVREGQTLWQIASLYQVDVNDLASINGLTPDTLLYPGQSLKLPAPSEVAYATYAMSPVASDVQPSPVAELEAPEPPATEVPVETTAESLDSQLKAEQEVALAELKQKREALKSSLADLKTLSKAEATPATAQSFAESSADSTEAAIEATEPSIPEETEIASRSTEIEIPVMTLPERATSESSSETLESLARSYTVVPETAGSPLAQPNLTAAAPTETALAEIEVETPKAIASADEVSVPTVPSLAVAIAPQQAESNNVTLSQPQTVVEAYRVNSGDTLSAIARQHGVSQSELIAFNGIDNPNLIKVDQVLRIPQQTVETPFSTATVAPQAITIASATPIPILDEENEADAQKPNSPELPLVVGMTPAAPAEEVAEEESLQVATASISRPTVAQPENRTTPQFGTEVQLDSYTEGLRSEIIKLREKYQAQKVNSVTVATRNEPAAEPQTVAVVSTTNDAASLGGSRVNPEFKSNSYTDGLQAEIRSLREQQASSNRTGTQPAAPSLNPPAVPQEQVVAAANVGSASYDPIVKTAIGQNVSPQLPPLAAADTYLPKESATFKGYIWPAEGVLTSGYGYRWGRMHRGIDIAAPVGTPIVASAPGVIITSGWNDGGYGNLVEIQHPDGSITLYAHNNRNLVRVGQQVEQGQQIAEMGSTGYSTGPHSHFEIHPSGQGAVNPMALLISRDG